MLDTLKSQQAADPLINSRAEHCHFWLPRRPRSFTSLQHGHKFEVKFRGWGMIKSRCHRRVDFSSSLHHPYCRLLKYYACTGYLRPMIVWVTRLHTIRGQTRSYLILGVDVSSTHLCKLLWCRTEWLLWIRTKPSTDVSTTLLPLQYSHWNEKPSIPESHSGSVRCTPLAFGSSRNNLTHDAPAELLMQNGQRKSINVRNL